MTHRGPFQPLLFCDSVNCINIGLNHYLECRLEQVCKRRICGLRHEVEMTEREQTLDNLRTSQKQRRRLKPVFASKDRRPDLFRFTPALQLRTVTLQLTPSPSPLTALASFRVATGAEFNIL